MQSGLELNQQHSPPYQPEDKEMISVNMKVRIIQAEFHDDEEARDAYRLAPNTQQR